MCIHDLTWAADGEIMIKAGDSEDTHSALARTATRYCN